MPDAALPVLPPELIPADCRDLMERLATVAAGLSRRIARGGLTEELGEARGQNADGDGQKALDVIADDAFQVALAGSAVRFYASEEQEVVRELNPEGAFALAIDPLDGSSNIGVNVSIGTIFALYPAAATAEASVLRPGREMRGAGYVIYGPQCALLLSFGAGVQKYLLDPETGRFHLVRAEVRLAPMSREFAINASNHRHWTAPVRGFVEECLAGATGPAGVEFNMRWIASLVAETHRILMRGGVFLYPSDARKGYEKGRLRLVYECGPVAFLIEQAGGAATDGARRILDLTPAGLHERTPFVFGCAQNVARIRDGHTAG